MGRGEGQADRNLGEHRTGGRSGFLDPHRTLSKRRTQSVTAALPAAPFLFELCSLSVLDTAGTKREHGRAAGQAHCELQLANAAVSLRGALRTQASGGIFPE